MLVEHTQRFIGSIVIFFLGVVLFSFLGMKKCYYEQTLTELGMIEQTLLEYETYRLTPEKMGKAKLAAPNTLVGALVSKEVRVNGVKEVVQVGSYTESKYLNSMIAQLKKWGYQPLVERTERANGKLYRVLIEVRNQNVKEIIADLKTKLHIEPLVVKLGNKLS